MKKLFETALPPLPETSVFHAHNRRVNSNQLVVAAAKFFESIDAGGRRIKIIGTYGTRQTNIRSSR
jgi:hypothetical protein